MISTITETEHRLRDLNGALDLAVLVACDRLRAAGDERDEQTIQADLIGETVERLRSHGRFPGRMSLFAYEEIEALWAVLRGDETHPLVRDLAHEVEFELARRPYVREPA